MESVQLLTSNVWAILGELSDGAGPVRAAIAYVTIAHIQFKAGDLLICDASDKAIRGGMTSAAVLSTFVDAGAEVHSIPGMHVKMGTFGLYSFIGSANMSKNAGKRTLEASLLTTDARVRSAVVGNLNDMLADPTRSRVDAAFIERIKQLPVASESAWPERESTFDISAPAAQSSWWVSTKPLSRRVQLEVDAQDAELTTAGQDALRRARALRPETVEDAIGATLSSVEWIVFRPNHPFLSRLQSGDVLVLCHKTASNRATVSAPATFLEVKILNRRAYVLYLPSTGGGTVAWSKVQARLRKTDSRLTVNSLRELKESESSIVDYLNTL